MSDREVMQQALEALSGVAQWVEKRPATHPWDAWQKVVPAIDALLAALAEPEPVAVAWQSMQVGIPVSETHDPEEAQKWRDSGVPVRALYAALPQRKPLTDDELAEVLALWDHWIKRTTLTHIARAVERAHGITGGNDE